MNEKKRKILIAAMKLFSKTSFHQTSMQQIADVCGVSKGSLYTHFKSKEELLSNIFSYYYQMLIDQIASSEANHDTAKETLIREIAIRIRHYYEFQEFFQMQLNELRGLDDPSLNQFVQQEYAKVLAKTKKSIIEVFGKEITPYAADLTITLKGLLTSYMYGIVEDGKTFDYNHLARYLFTQLSAIAKRFIEKQSDPFFVTPPWQAFSKKTQEETLHPIQIVRKIKEAVKNEDQLTIESVEILEGELMEIRPRTAILSGMIHNLQQNTNLVELVNELEKALIQINVNPLV